MNRGQFFKGMLALIGLQGIPIGTQEYQKGEELCPLSHAQKPTIRFLHAIVVDPKNALTLQSDRICATCGIVYVKQEGKG